MDEYAKYPPLPDSKENEFLYKEIERLEKIINIIYALFVTFFSIGLLIISQLNC